MTMKSLLIRFIIQYLLDRTYLRLCSTMSTMHIKTIIACTPQAIIVSNRHNKQIIISTFVVELYRTYSYG